MVNFLRFCWLCLKEAWGGLFDAANAWATVLGTYVIYVSLGFWGYRLIPPETFEGVIALAVLSLIAAGVGIFNVRLISAPARLYMRAKTEADELRKIIDSDAVKDRAVDLQDRRQHTAALMAVAEAYKLAAPPAAIAITPPSPPLSDSSGAWKPTPEAIEAFAEPELIAVRDKQAERFYEGYMKAREAEDEIQKIKNKFGNDTTLESEDVAMNQRRLTAYNIQTSHAEDGLRMAWAALRTDIDSKLTRGLLIAKGFRSPHIAGREETEILMAEWRILDLNNVTSCATKKMSNDVLYTGVAIRRAD
jgi:hypothetical protein